MNLIVSTITKKEFEYYKKTYEITYAYYLTEVGKIKVGFRNNIIHEVCFVDNINSANNINNFDISELPGIKIQLTGTEFQIKVWQETLKIPKGQTITYHDLAKRIGQPNAFRAVANALGSNKIAYFVPCHRIIRKNGQMGGYKWGIERKLALLKFESCI